jgi:hypothetical protein
MLELIERKLREAKAAIKDEKTPIKYRKIAANDARKIQKELNTIYTMYSKIRRYEEKVCNKFEIETY